MEGAWCSGDAGLPAGSRVDGFQVSVSEDDAWTCSYLSCSLPSLVSSTFIPLCFALLLYICFIVSTGMVYCKVYHLRENMALSLSC